MVTGDCLLQNCEARSSSRLFASEAVSFCGRGGGKGFAEEKLRQFRRKSLPECRSREYVETAANISKKFGQLNQAKGSLS